MIETPAQKVLSVPNNFQIFHLSDEFGSYTQVEWNDPETGKHVGIKKHHYPGATPMIRVEHKPFDFIELVFVDLESRIYDLLRR